MQCPVFTSLLPIEKLGITYHMGLTLKLNRGLSKAYSELLQNKLMIFLNYPLTY